MNRWMQTLAGGVSFLVIGPPAWAAQTEPPCAAALHHGIAACVAGRYGEARATLEASLASPCLAEADPVRVTAVEALGRVDQALGAYARAADLHREVIRLADESTPKGKRILSIAANNLGAIDVEQGRWEEADPLLERTLSLSRAIYGERDPALGVAMKNLGGLYVMESRWQDGARLLEEAVSIFRAAGAQYHPELVTSLSVLGLAYTELENREAAMPLLEEAVSLGTAALPADPVFADALVALAALWRANGQPARAEPLLRKAAAIYESAGPAAGIRGGSLWTNLGLLRLQEGNSIEAERDLRRAVEILKRSYGPEHAAVAAVEVSLARACLALRKFKDAEALLRHAYGIEKRAYGDGPTLARCRFVQDELERARRR